MVGRMSRSAVSAHSYEELVKDYDVTYVAGGAAQNAARAAAVSGESIVIIEQN